MPLTESDFIQFCVHTLFDSALDSAHSPDAIKYVLGQWTAGINSIPASYRTHDGVKGWKSALEAAVPTKASAAAPEA